MTEPYRVAIIGTGRRGGLMEDTIAPGLFDKPYGHFTCYGMIDETEVVAVANRGVDRLRQFSERFGVRNTYLDYREMIDKERPDIVSVTTRSWARADAIVYAAEHGVRGIYAEKGLCSSLEEADRIRAACQAHHVAFVYGAWRRYHDGFKKLRSAIERGDIGRPLYAAFYALSDLSRHHSHAVDTVEMLLGDPAPQWVEGRFLGMDDPLMSGYKTPLPPFDALKGRYELPPGQEIGDPVPGFYRVGYEGRLEAVFLPLANRFDFDVYGTEGWVSAWDNGQEFRIRRSSRWKPEAQEVVVRPRGESPTMCTIRALVHELAGGERTSGNVDTTLYGLEAQFGLAESHHRGGQRVTLPNANRTLYIPGG
jgi:predicted dehydrogenase